MILIKLLNVAEMFESNDVLTLYIYVSRVSIMKRVNVHRVCVNFPEYRVFTGARRKKKIIDVSYWNIYYYEKRISGHLSSMKAC